MAAAQSRFDHRPIDDVEPESDSNWSEVLANGSVLRNCLYGCCGIVVGFVAGVICMTMIHHGGAGDAASAAEAREPSQGSGREYDAASREFLERLDSNWKGEGSHAGVVAKVDALSAETACPRATVSHTFAVALERRPPHHFDGQVFAAVSEAVRRSKDSSTQIATAVAIMQLRAAFPAWTAKGAAAELERDGDREDYIARVLPGIVQAREMGGGQDYPFYYAFVKILPRWMAPDDVGHAIGMLRNAAFMHGDRQALSQDLPEVWDWIRSPAGRDARPEVIAAIGAPLP
jgi:hypothetical protein